MSVGGKKKIRAEDVFERITEYDVYRKYYNKGEFEPGALCLNPWVDEKHPSCIIGERDDGVLGFKCYNSEHRGDCIDFVRYMYNTDYQGALRKIAYDFGISGDGSIKTDNIITYKQPKIVKKPVILDIDKGEWREWHLKYLKRYHLKPSDFDFLLDTYVWPLKNWALNKQKMPLEPKEVVLGYELIQEDGRWLKIYRAERDKRSKWLSNIPFTKLHNKGAISGCDVGILTKSVKEAAWINKYILPNVEIIQAEDPAALTDEDKKRIKQSCKRLYICLDNDRRGKETSHILTKELECFHINPPDYLLKEEVTDITDWAEHSGNQPVINHFKTKIPGICLK